MSLLEQKQPSTSAFLHNLPEGWKEYIHPNGWRYFYHPELHAVSPSEGIINNLNVVRKSDVAIEYEVVLDNDGSVEMYVDHDRRYAFEKIPLKDDEENIDELHVKYWDFMRKFPCHKPIISCRNKYLCSGQCGCEAFHAATQVLHFFKMDLLRRRLESEAPLTLSQCSELLDYLDSYEDSNHMTFQGIPSQTSAFTALISWILWSAVKHKIVHNHGGYMMGISPHSQLNNEDHTTWTILFHFLSSVLCFGAPRSHFERISLAFRRTQLQDRVDSWVAFLEQFDRELTVSNLGATVLLSSSTAFLAVSGIDKLSRIITLVSVALTLGSVTTGIYLQWQTGKLTFKDLKIDSRVLALAFSVPFAALIWAVMLFMVAVITYSILGTLDSGDTFGRTTWIPTLAVCCVFVVIGAVLVMMFRFIRHKHNYSLGSSV
ncbi:hypothetical protein GYMLUDRAFT_263778 [Collybiopsis luxurians FD-317 M1]|uniref:Unplaced genomic scaffold GYMLUscaffold_51, whole genome shotgun sequence n=1 Tax=Collybiopsis luxurians FD-317 M1 TaxID=944289 RepID=A0A0D0CE10_9AGAR|nr:hypothetical protein GYMLUDRAFT_263778 [Collybiopsis luxurians FD-317 M1]